MEATTPKSRNWVVLALKILLLAAVVWGVARTLQQGWTELGQRRWQVSWGWLVASGAIYVAGLLPLAWFWRQAMIALGGRPAWRDTLPAYFVGHLAKYVPGKVLVVVLRAGTIPRDAVSLRVAVVSVFLETFTLMAVGGVVVVALSPLVLELDRRGVAIALAVAFLVGLPTLPPVARTLMRRIEAVRYLTQAGEPGQPIDGQGINLQLMLAGWLAGGLAWAGFGASLGAMLTAIGADGGSVAGDLPLLMVAIALATVAGFVSFLPGGLGVRDVLLVGLLAPHYGDATALVASAGLRLVWIISELVVYGILYVTLQWQVAGRE